MSLHAAETATHAATAGMRIRTVGVRSIARRIAKHTSVGFAKAAVQRQQQTQQVCTAVRKSAGSSIVRRPSSSMTLTRNGVLTLTAKSLPASVCG